MLGTLITLGLGMFGLGSAIVDSANEESSKRDAESSGLPYYWDRKNRQRSIKTGEICTYSASDSRHHGHTVLRGVNTGRVYYDYTLEKAKQLNEEAKRKGQKFYWKEYPNVHPHHCVNAPYGASAWYAFDPEVGLPYTRKISFGSGWDCVNGRMVPRNKPSLKITYYKEPRPGEKRDSLEYDHSRTVYGDEIKLYNYGCFPTGY